tara:strand:+ start:745 stop:1659 length:915 start_codon:yes stop_codon:yes gene_type:complete
MHPLAIVTFALLAGAPAIAQSPAATQDPSPRPKSSATQRQEQTTELSPFRSVAGAWIGTLAYRDYRSGKRVSIPSSATIDVAPDSSYVVRRIEYNDPGRTIYALDTLSVDRERGEITSTFVQGGGNVEQTKYRVVERDVTDDDKWSMVLATVGRDDGKDVDVRVTMSLRDGVLLTKKTVRATADTDAKWLVRNELELRRLAPEPRALLGTWRVDLRPTPGAAPYYKEMVIESVANKQLAGSFYDSEMRDSRLDATWGELRLAFITADGSGNYHTSAVLVGDTLVGTTHSIGRGFLSRWTATKKK